jgi:energy-converting hydrogenase Eha subunit C
MILATMPVDGLVFVALANHRLITAAAASAWVVSPLSVVKSLARLDACPACPFTRLDVAVAAARLGNVSVFETFTPVHLAIFFRFLVCGVMSG